jgi:hypothetical protein
VPSGGARQRVALDVVAKIVTSCEVERGAGNRVRRRLVVLQDGVANAFSPLREPLGQRQWVIVCLVPSQAEAIRARLSDGDKL